MKYTIMERVVIDIPDKKFGFFMELMKNLGIKKVRRLTRDQKKFVDDLRRSLEQVEEHQEGKIKLRTAEDLLNEL